MTLPVRRRRHLVLRRRNYQPVLQASPALAHELRRALTARLRATDELAHA